MDEKWKEDFPKMPDEIRNMIAEEVERQTRKPGRTSGKARRKKGRMAAAILVAAAVTGTTVLAASQLYRIYSEKEGKFGVRLGVQMGQEAPAHSDTGEKLSETVQAETAAEGKRTDPGNRIVLETAAAGEEESVALSVPSAQQLEEGMPDFTLSAGYVPEGLVETDPGHYVWQDFYDHPDTAVYRGGISSVVMGVEREDEGKELLLRNVVFSEEIELAGRQGIYLEFGDLDRGKAAFSKRIYLYVPEYGAMILLHIGEDISKEDALKFGEALELIPTGSYTPWEKLRTWGDEIAQEEGTEIDWTLDEQTEIGKEGLPVYQVGESLSPILSAELEEGGEMTETQDISMKVTQVQTAEDLSLLEASSNVDERWRQALDENGKLLPGELVYVKTGDGVNTANQVVKRKETPLKLVYLTLEFTNNGENTWKNILFNGCLTLLEENGDSYQIYDQAEAEPGEWDLVYSEGLGDLLSGEMRYFDPQGGIGTNGRNYISSLGPGERATVHMAWILKEEDLDKMYFSNGGHGEVITEKMQRDGCVDIRQERNGVDKSEKQ